MGSNSDQRSGSSGDSKARDRGKRQQKTRELRGSGARSALEKRDARERRLAEQRKRGRRRLLVIGAIVAVAVFGLVGVWASDVFPIGSVVVEGVSTLTEDSVRELAAVPSDATLLRFPADEVRKRVEADPWVQSATVTRDFPDTMVITVTERQPAALVDMLDDYLIIDADGWIIESQSLEETTSLVVIRDVEGLDPTPGRRSPSEALHNALAILDGLSSELRAITRAISVATIDETALLTVEGVEIFFGAAEDVAKKDAIAREILSEQEGAVVFIDVRTVSRPIWRGLEE